MNEPLEIWPAGTIVLTGGTDGFGRAHSREKADRVCRELSGATGRATQPRRTQWTHCGEARYERSVRLVGLAPAFSAGRP